MDTEAQQVRRVQRQRERRALRKQLGFCADCLEPAAPGVSRCIKHFRDHKRRWRISEAGERAKRGWVWGKVKV